MASKIEARLAKRDEQLSKHDREIAAIRKLILQGMKMLVENQRLVKDVAAAQKRTEATLDRFIRSLERGGMNGHHKTAPRQ